MWCRYTYLFPAPYPGPAQDSASRFHDFADNAGGGGFFGPTPSSGEGVPHQSQRSGMVRMKKILVVDVKYFVW